MICKDCGREYTPLACPSCGGALGGDSCPACTEGNRVVCTSCGQELEIARVDAEVSEGISPDGARPGEVPHGIFGGTPETMSGEMADIEVAASAMPPPPEHPAAGETFDHIMGADAQPEPPRPGERETMSDEQADLTVAESTILQVDEPVAGAENNAAPVPPPVWDAASVPPPAASAPPAPEQAPPPPPPYQPPYQQAPPVGQAPPAGQAPPPQGQQPWGQPQQGAPSYGQPYNAGYSAPPPAYGAPGQPYPPGGYPGQSYYPLPREKVKLGGWLMVYLVFCCIGLAFSAIDLISTLGNYGPSALTIILDLVLIGISVMIVVSIIQRNIRFRVWFLVRAILGFVQAGFLCFAAIGVGALSGSSYLLDEYLYDLYYMLPAEFDYSFFDAILSVLAVFFVIAAIILVAWYVCWLIYFRRSKRVAYTFDPLNNPPRR